MIKFESVKKELGFPLNENDPNAPNADEPFKFGIDEADMDTLLYDPISKMVALEVANKLLAHVYCSKYDAIERGTKFSVLKRLSIFKPYYEGIPQESFMLAIGYLTATSTVASRSTILEEIYQNCETIIKENPDIKKYLIDNFYIEEDIDKLRDVLEEESLESINHVKPIIEETLGLLQDFKVPRKDFTAFKEIVNTVYAKHSINFYSIEGSMVYGLLSYEIANKLIMSKFLTGIRDYLTKL